MPLAFTKALISSMIMLVNCGNGDQDGCSNGNLRNGVSLTKHLEASMSEPIQAETKSTVSDPLANAKQYSAKDRVMLNIPFSPQAPNKDWSAPYDEACEETSIIMVEYFLRGIDLTPETADTEIKSMVTWQQERGFGVDIGASATAFHAGNFYHRKTHLYYDTDVTEQNIKKLLSAGYPIIIPTAGKTLANPNFRNGGPPYHMIVLTGYDSNNFFAHDPGTQFGANYAYPTQTIMNAIHDWNGSKNTVNEAPGAMLVITK